MMGSAELELMALHLEATAAYVTAWHIVEARVTLRHQPRVIADAFFQRPTIRQYGTKLHRTVLDDLPCREWLGPLSCIGQPGGRPPGNNEGIQRGACLRSFHAHSGAQDSDLLLVLDPDELPPPALLRHLQMACAPLDVVHLRFYPYLYDLGCSQGGPQMTGGGSKTGATRAYLRRWMKHSTLVDGDATPDELHARAVSALRLARFLDGAHVVIPSNVTNGLDRYALYHFSFFQSAHGIRMKLSSYGHRFAPSGTSLDLVGARALMGCNPFPLQQPASEKDRASLRAAANLITISSPCSSARRPYHSPMMQRLLHKYLPEVHARGLARSPAAAFEVNISAWRNVSGGSGGPAAISDALLDPSLADGTALVRTLLASARTAASLEHHTTGLADLLGVPAATIAHSLRAVHGEPRSNTSGGGARCATLATACANGASTSPWSLFRQPSHVSCDVCAEGRKVLTRYAHADIPSSTSLCPLLAVEGLQREYAATRRRRRLLAHVALRGHQPTHQPTMDAKGAVRGHQPTHQPTMDAKVVVRGHQPTMDAVTSGASQDAEQIHNQVAKFLRDHDCHHVYMDVGTNIGVQLRKLFEPWKYPDAAVLPTFERLFGPVPRCNVCALGFEPNQRHKARLKHIQASLRGAGAAVLILHAAALTYDGTIAFDPGHDGQNEDWGGTTAPWRQSSPEASHNRVVAIDLARVLSHVQQHLSSRRAEASVFMKLDVEGSEYLVLPHLALTGRLCTVDEIHIEWHPAGGKDVDAGAATATRTVEHFSSLLSERRPPCCTQLLAVDDESYLHDTDAAGVAVPMPAPNSICANSEQRSNRRHKPNSSETNSLGTSLGRDMATKVFPPRCPPLTLADEARSSWRRIRRHVLNRLTCSRRGLCKLLRQEQGISSAQVEKLLLNGVGAIVLVIVLICICPQGRGQS